MYLYKLLYEEMGEKMKNVIYILFFIASMSLALAQSEYYGNTTLGTEINNYGIIHQQLYPTTKFIYSINNYNTGFNAVREMINNIMGFSADYGHITLYSDTTKYFHVEPSVIIIPRRSCEILSTDENGTIYCSDMPILNNTVIQNCTRIENNTIYLNNFTGYTGACYTGKIIVKNGLVIGCKR